MATRAGDLRYRVSAGTGWPGVSILWLGEMESLICSFYLNVTVCKIVWVDPSLRYTLVLLRCYATNKQTLTFCTTFSDLDLRWGSQDQWKPKLVSFIFSHTFNWPEWGFMWSWMWCWTSRQYEVYGIKEITAVLLAMSKTLACIQVFEDQFRWFLAWW